MGKNSRQGPMSAQEQQRLAYVIRTAEAVRLDDLMRRFQRDQYTLKAAAERLGLMEELRAKMQAAAATRLK